MRFLTPSQCRAARGLLKWSQPDLSKHCGVNVQTICAFENEAGTPTKRTLQKIVTACEKAGIVFTEQGGVNPNTSDIIIYEGKHGFRTFMDDVYETAKKHGGNIYLFNSSPRLWYEWLGEEWYAMHSERMKALGDKINVKITVQEGDDFLILRSAQHRWFPKGLSKNKIFYAYGPKLGFLDFSDDGLRISVVNQKDFADIFRVLYDIAWENVTLEIPESKGK